MADRIGVMFVTNTLTTGGAEHVLIDLVRRLADHPRYRPVVVCLKDRGPQADVLLNENVAVHPHLLNDKYDVKIIPRLCRLIAAERVAVIVPVGSGGDRMFWSTLAGKLAGIKTVVWAHVYSQPNHLCFERANRVLYPLVDRFVALGRRHRRSMAWLDKIPPGRTAVINNGIDVKRFDHPEWRDHARAILGLADENVVAIAMIANLRADKRHDLFIRAARLVVERRRNVHFFIIGDGPGRPAVQHWAQESELLGQYLSVLGERSDIPQILPGLDLLTLCSEYHECLSLSALQAMAARVPVVSYFIGSMDEAIIDNETGFFFHQLSAAALAQRLLDVIAAPQLRQDVAERAHDLVRRKFTLEQMTNNFIALFDDLLP